MKTKYECPNCSEALPFGALTDMCPQCKTLFGYSSKFSPVLSKNIQHRNTTASADHPPSQLISTPKPGADDVIKSIFRGLQISLGITLITVAGLVFYFPLSANANNRSHAEIYIPGLIALIGVCIISARKKVTTFISVTFGVIVSAILWLLIMLIGALSFSK